MNIEELKQKPTLFQLDVGARQLSTDLLALEAESLWMDFCELKKGTSDSEAESTSLQEYKSLYNNVMSYMGIIADLIDDYVHDYDSFMNTTVPNTFLNGKIVAAREPAVNSIKDLENRAELMESEKEKESLKNVIKKLREGVNENLNMLRDIIDYDEKLRSVI